MADDKVMFSSDAILPEGTRMMVLDRVEGGQEQVMAVRERVSEQAYREIVLREPDITWELHNGRLREKPGMSWEHDDVMALLGHLLQSQLNRDEYRVRINSGRVRRSPENFFVPDIVVIPAARRDVFGGRPGTLPIFRDPLPLVVEVWSPSTGGYDVDTKLPEYQARSDQEIWRVHPYERTLTAWPLRPDGGYDETVYREGMVRPASLPGVVIDLETLFED